MPCGETSAAANSRAKGGGSGSDQPCLISFVMLLVNADEFTVDLWLPYAMAASRSFCRSSSSIGLRGKVEPCAMHFCVRAQSGWRCMSRDRKATGLNSDLYDTGEFGCCLMAASSPPADLMSCILCIAASFVASNLKDGLLIGGKSVSATVLSSWRNTRPTIGGLSPIIGSGSWSSIGWLTG